MFKNRLFYFLLLIFCLGFTLRAMGIGYGLPYLSHPDEARIVLDTLSMGHRHSLLPVRIDYPLLFRYLLLFIYGIYYLLGRLFHFFSGPYDFALKFLIDPTGIYLVSRMVNVIIGSVMAIPAYMLGKNIFKDKRIGVVSFIFVLF